MFRQPVDAIESNCISFIAVASDLGLGFSAGLGFYVPFGGSSVYDQKDNLDNYPGAIDGPQRWWAIEGTIQVCTLRVPWATELSPKLSIGAGLNIVKSEVFTAARTRLEQIVNTEGRALDVSHRVVARCWDYLGTIRWLFLGVSYQSAPTLVKVN